ncbi:MAG: aromatic ring-hydroxylating dioxygenase subunit alpha [Gammaproteobacteria bacterium]|nr:aromatic ring-hydroxylating dioxygenase subunit alpha [Gammaproteobacteria bacterium]MDH3536346.1 aromatic ring-hydroxylating dioxygenase subunit alpha [Gammaproteobacteria bacterium]
MPRLSADQQQVKVDFLRQVRDGRLDRPTAEGSGLPNLTYTCPDFYRLEQQTVFRNNWVFAGFAHRLARVGDMLPVEIAGQPVVLVKSEDGFIRAFHNACRHRGAQLVTGCRNSKKFVCPNHSWSYSLQGKLIARPHFHGGEQHDINKSDCHRADLVALRCVTWHDWIFVNISGDADDFDACIEPFSAQLEGYDFGALGFCDTLEFDLAANWKLAIENFIEPYHVFSCHPWLNGFVGMEEREAPVFDGKVLSCGYDFKQSDPARGGALPWFPALPAAKQNRGDWFILFPNFGFEIFPDQVDVFVAWPRGPDSCRETIALYFVGDGATAAEYSEARALVMQNWNNLNQEDIGVVERMQRGRNSDGFDGGVLSPYWDPVLQHFARLLADAIEAETIPGS